MSMRRWVSLVFVVSTASCASDPPTPVEAAASDCKAHGGVPYGSSTDDLVCVDGPPVDRQDFGATTIDTDQSPLCAAVRSGPDGCVIAATEIIVDGRLRATGDRPLILAADSIEVTAAGVIDVAAHSGDPAPGAGAGAPECEEREAPTTFEACGAGGSFGGAGGNNLARQDCITDSPRIPTTLRGGCRGHRGLSGGGPGGAGGEGGGAVLVIAQSLTLGGKINASGAGGAGAGSTMNRGGNGGGGGGAGGLIALDARRIAGTGMILANGGGGGAGEGQFMQASLPGSDPDEATPLVSAAGAPGVDCCGFPSPGAAGGSGAAGAVRDGVDGADVPSRFPLVDFSRGGGGGGAGVIRFYAKPFTTGTVSPAP